MYLSMLETEADKILFERLYVEDRQMLYLIAFKVLGNVSDSEDAVHTCFLNLAKNFEKYRYESYENLEKLCRAIVKNAAMDIVRTRSKLTQFSEEAELGEEAIIDDGPDILEQLILKHDRKIVFKALMGLTESERELLDLQYSLGMKPKDIAKIFNISSDAARARLLRCRAKLAALLEENGYEVME